MTLISHAELLYYTIKVLNCSKFIADTCSVVKSFQSGTVRGKKENLYTLVRD